MPIASKKQPTYLPEYRFPNDLNNNLQNDPAHTVDGANVRTIAPSRGSKHVSIPLTAGVNAMRIAAYNKRTLKAMFVSTEPGGYFSVAPYFSAGLSVGF